MSELYCVPNKVVGTLKLQFLVSLPQAFRNAVTDSWAAWTTHGPGVYFTNLVVLFSTKGVSGKQHLGSQASEVTSLCHWVGIL